MSKSSVPNLMIFARLTLCAFAVVAGTAVQAQEDFLKNSIVTGDRSSILNGTDVSKPGAIVDSIFCNFKDNGTVLISRTRVKTIDLFNSVLLSETSDTLSLGLTSAKIDELKALANDVYLDQAKSEVLAPGELGVSQHYYVVIPMISEPGSYFSPSLKYQDFDSRVRTNTLPSAQKLIQFIDQHCR